MQLDGKHVLVCNCENTMPLDGKALAKACGARAGGEIATQLCRAELGRFQKALDAGLPLTVACTQESALFEEQREESGSKTPVAYVNIRETAGWSSEAAAATPAPAQRPQRSVRRSSEWPLRLRKTNRPSRGY